MAKLNVSDHRRVFTHEGAPAKHISPEQELSRTVLACLLWEKTFYESGQNVADHIRSLVPKCSLDFLHSLAVKARSEMHLRHVPLLLAYAMTEHPASKPALHEKHKTPATAIRNTLRDCIQRPDELGEFVAMYRKFAKSRTLPRQVKKGLADALRKFSEFDLVKWDQNNAAVKLRDVIFLTHAKPENDEQAKLWASIVNKAYYPDKTKSGFNLAKIYGLKGKVSHPVAPDTWEVNLSVAGKADDKKAIWTRLLEERKLGGLALLRNLRNMEQADVDHSTIFDAIEHNAFRRVLPFRFIAAARYAPWAESALETAFIRTMAQSEKWLGKTVLLVDVSSSMHSTISAKSDMTRLDAACGLAMILQEINDDCRVYTFSNQLVEVPSRHGFALRDAIYHSQPHSGTYLGGALNRLHESNKFHDRIIVITDEQSHDKVPDPKTKGYMINVASYKNGVGYGPWLHIDGFSEAVVKYMMAYEQESSEVVNTSDK